MAVRRINGAWCVEFQQGGKRVFRRLPAFASKGEALALETKLRREIFHRDQLGQKDEPSLAAAIQLWLTHAVPHLKDQRKPAQNARLLAPFVRGKMLREAPDAARQAVSAWTCAATTTTPASTNAKLATNAMPLSPATINRRLSILKAAARYAWEQGWIEQNLSGRIKALPGERRREVYLTAAQVRKLARAAPTNTCRSAIMVAAYSGLRAAELLALPRTHALADSLIVIGGKTGSRTVPIVGLLRPYLSALPLGLSYRQLIGQFWAARERAGMPHVRWHDLRHTTASLLINAGVPLEVVGKILGHSSTQTTARYAHLADATLRKAMRKLK